MNPERSLRTVLTVVSGASAVRARAFAWGAPVAPFGVGGRAEWRVEAPGVEPLHFYVSFDGRQLHVAAPGTNDVRVDATAVGPAWTAVPVGAELCFGQARLRVSCEELGPLAAPEAARAAPPMRAPSRRTEIIARQGVPVGAPPVAPAAGFVTVAPPVQAPPGVPVQRTLAGRAAATRTVALARPRREAPALAPSSGVAPATQALPRTPIVPLRPLGRTPVMPERLESVRRSLVVNVTPSAETAQGMTTALPERRHLEPRIPSDGATVSDEGALRELAARVLTSAGSAPPELSVAPPPMPEPPTRVFVRRRAGARGWLQKASLPKKLIVILLPVAGYLSLFWEAPRHERTRIATARAERKPASVRAGSARARPGAEPGARASSTRVNREDEIRALPGPSSSAASVPEPMSPAPSVRTVRGASARTLSAPSSARQRGAQREAYMALLEGNLAEAAILYEGLATGPNGRVFALAARFATEKAVRKP